MTVELALLPEVRQTLVVVGTSVRKPKVVLDAYLKALAWQDLPPNTVLKPVFVPDGLEPDAELLLRDWTAEHDGELLRGLPAGVQDFSDAHPETHQWSPSAMQRVGANKDRILQRARQLNADFVWLCDADLICDPTTLRSLLGCAAPIATAVYWTRWSKSGTETRQIHAAPQVWLRHPYQLDGFGWSEAQFREKLVKREIIPVPGYGACTLISRQSIEAGVSFAPLPDVPMQGLMAGEDRHFCIRAQRLHQQSVADAWPDIFHIYNLADDVPKIPEWEHRLGRRHHQHVRLGDLVSLTITPLEPIAWAGGGYTQVPPQHVRGRIGALSLVPELEEAVYGLERGHDEIVPVHFPVHYPAQVYAGKRRLFRVKLHDVKPISAQFPPTLEEEMIVGQGSRAALRTVEYTTQQLDGMRELAEASA